MYEHSRRTLTIASLAVLATFLDTTILYVAFPDITASIRNICVGEDVVVFETTMVGTNTGPLRLGRSEVAPTGKQMTLLISVHMWFRDGLGSGERVFYDRLGMLRQLGLPLS